jgi:sugar phosphate isomerase/epimerase
MRLGGPVFGKWTDPDGWAKAVRDLGYGAAYCPAKPGDDDATVAAYEKAAAGAGIVIAEVGAWSNPLSPDETEAKAALAKCKASLALADRIGARCCVNVGGAPGRQWAGPHPDALKDVTFNRIVAYVREIIDEVKPRRSFYTLETMPWMLPDTADNYLRLLKAIDRKQFAVHFDAVNLIYSPQRYFDTAGVIREFVAKLGPHIRSCHAKDVLLDSKATTHLDEVRPGLGGLDYCVLLTELDKLDPDTPLMLEHLSKAEQYAEAAQYVRGVAGKAGVKFRM